MHGRFGRTKTVIDADALDRARQAVSDRTRDVEDVTARGQRWRDWREDTREDRALAHDVNAALRAGTPDGRDDRSLDLARERHLEHAEREYGGF